MVCLLDQRCNIPIRKSWIHRLDLVMLVISFIANFTGEDSFRCIICEFTVFSSCQKSSIIVALPVIRRLTAVMMTDYDLKMSKVATERDGTVTAFFQSRRAWGVNNQRRDLALKYINEVGLLIA